MEERYVDTLAKYIITLMTIALVAGLCWMFRSVIVYVLLAAFIALVSRPVFKFFSSLHIKKVHLPDWTAAALTLVFVLGLFICVFLLIVPVVSNVIKDISKVNVNNLAQAVSVPLYSLNQTLINLFPKLGFDFKIENVLLEQLQGLFDFSSVSSVLGSVASSIAAIGVGLFAMIFISFFFIKDPKVFANIVVAFVPERLEQKTRESLAEIDVLISRYFIGLITEVLGVSVLNFLGLYFAARMGFRYSIGIAFLTGLLNVVPYIGPLIGGCIGVSLSLVIKYVCATSFGLNASFLVFVAVLIGVFVLTQLVDNYVYQPLIYSNSIKAHPLEIFIVLLLAGHVGGILGMLVAIPSYTVIRVFAVKFFGYKKAIRMLTGTAEQE